MGHRCVRREGGGGERISEEDFEEVDLTCVGACVSEQIYGTSRE